MQSQLFEKTFGNERNDVIEVQPNSSTISGTDNEKPLSRLKQQRLKEKETKIKRKYKQHHQEAMKRTPMPKNKVPKKEKEKGFIPEKAKWKEVKEVENIVRNTISQFINIAIEAMGLLNNPFVTLEDEGKDMISSRANLIFKDSENLETKLNELVKPIKDMSGVVDINYLPQFLAIYEDVLNLNQDVLNVLTDPASELTEMLQLVHNKLKEAKPNE